jgi:hypothetical protein
MITATQYAELRSRLAQYDEWAKHISNAMAGR